MIPFERVGETLVTELDDFEVALVSSLVSQVSELVGAAGGGVGGAASGQGHGRTPGRAGASGHGAAHEEDPFARWADEFGGAAELDRSDPVIKRLFPDAYDDAAAAAEHRRFSQPALRRGRIADSELVIADLAATDDGNEPLVIALDRVEAWVKTLNGVRLSLAVRLGIESEGDHEALERLPARDPRTQIVSLYDWLAVVLESLLEAAATTGGPG